MDFQLNHTIIQASDPDASAAWFGELFGLGEAERFGPFLQFTTANGVNLDYDRSLSPVTPQHYAFLVGEDDFDAIYGRILERGLTHFADPHGRLTGQINHHDGGRGVYFPDPDGHLFEIITVPYGG